MHPKEPERKQTKPTPSARFEGKVEKLEKQMSREAFICDRKGRTKGKTMGRESSEASERTVGLRSWSHSASAPSPHAAKLSEPRGGVDKDKRCPSDDL